MNSDTLEQEIGYQLRQLKQTAESAELLYREAVGDPRPWHSAAAAKYISDLMLGLENLWRRRCRHLQCPLPHGPSSHRQILADFLDDGRLGGRLPEGFSQRLGLYLRFRHRFVHGYGFELKWEIVEEPLRLLSDTINRLTECWEEWLSGFSSSG